MNAESTPFDRLSSSFQLWASVGGKWGSDFIPMSAGVNWLPASPAVLTQLKRELESAATYRNYGRAVGGRPVTTVLEMIANLESNSSDCRVAIFNGATEAAATTIEGLLESGRIAAGCASMMIGHGFPLYARLSARFRLQFKECLGPADSSRGYLPTFDEVLTAIDAERPQVIFLLIPNNPFGEQLTPTQIRHLCDQLSSLDAYLLVDRVCQMPWDSRHPIMEALAAGISDGRVVVVDSFSKSESLAGLRTGFAIANDAWIVQFEQMLKSRVLNPIVFSTVTLALTRLAEVGTSLAPKVKKLIEPHLVAIYSEYPASEPRYNPLSTFETFRDEYLKEQADRKAVIDGNFQALVDKFASRATRPLTLTSGFNVTMTLPPMRSEREHEDQHRLAYEYGVGILPESCFRVSYNTGPHYFVRVGLTPPLADFSIALERLEQFYGH